jgi:hypothetical protein
MSKGYYLLILLHRLLCRRLLFGLTICCSLSAFGDTDYQANDELFDHAVTPYVDLGLGLSLHVLDESDEGAASQLIKTAIGVQWLPFLSTQVGLWHWASEEQSSSDDEEERASFDGLSASWEVAVQLPFNTGYSQFHYGPYYRFGRHCWSAVFTGLVEPWSKEGCSDLQTLGFLFPAQQSYEEGAILYLEFSRSHFAEVSTNSIQLGAKLAL